MSTIPARVRQSNVALAPRLAHRIDRRRPGGADHNRVHNPDRRNPVQPLTLQEPKRVANWMITPPCGWPRSIFMPASAATASATWAARRRHSPISTSPGAAGGAKSAVRDPRTPSHDVANKFNMAWLFVPAKNAVVGANDTETDF